MSCNWSGDNQSDPYGVDKQKRGEDFVCSVADALESGDKVIINNRQNALTVLGRDEDANHGFVSQPDYPYKIVWLRGNGTEYRLRYSHTGEYFPILHSESQLESRESFCHRCREEHVKTRATTGGRRVRILSIRGVDDDQLASWALARNIDGFSQSASLGDADE